MRGVLAVERSGSLMHLLERTLDVAKVQIEDKCADYQRAFGLLSQSLNDLKLYPALVLGAPSSEVAEFTQILRFLAEQTIDLPVVLVAHQRYDYLVSWLELRGNGILLQWSEFSRVPAALRQLMPRHALGPQRTDGAGFDVLFVDDSASVRFAYRQLLERAGYAVDVAIDIREALEKVSAKRYDLVIVDYFLPDGTGDEVCRHVRSHLPAPQPALALITGSYKEELVKSALEAGALECMFKHEPKELFLARIETLVRTLRVERRLRTEEATTAAVLDLDSAANLLFDADLRLTKFNRAAAQGLNYKAEDAGQKPAWTLTHREAPLDGAESELLKAMKQRLAGPIQFELVQGERKLEVLGTLTPLESAAFKGMRLRIVLPDAPVPRIDAESGMLTVPGLLAEHAEASGGTAIAIGLERQSSISALTQAVALAYTLAPEPPRARLDATSFVLYGSAHDLTQALLLVDQLATGLGSWARFGLACGPSPLARLIETATASLARAREHGRRIELSVLG